MILDYNSKTDFYTVHNGFGVGSPELQGSWDGTPFSLQTELEEMGYFIELTVISPEDKQSTWLELSGVGNNDE
jgi:hypothetical protein